MPGGFHGHERLQGIHDACVTPSHLPQTTVLVLVSAHLTKHNRIFAFMEKGEKQKQRSAYVLFCSEPRRGAHSTPRPRAAWRPEMR